MIQVIELTPHGDGFLLTVHVTPGAKRDAVGGEHDGGLRVSTTQPADRGKANKRVIELVAKALGIKRHQIELVSGQTHRHKKLKIDGVAPEPLAEVVKRLGEG